MTTKTLQRFTPDQIDAAKRADIRDLAGRYVELRKCSGSKELAGPCPKCGGDDRFHCTAEWFFCRAGTCHPKHGDAIEFVRWMEGLSFTDAVERLLGGAVVTLERVQATPKRCEVKKQDAGWKEHSERFVKSAQQRLWAPDGKAGQEYLERRGLEPSTWQAFGLGFDPAVKYGEDGLKLPAIIMPWISRAGLFAVRYRFLENDAGARLTSRTGSELSGKLYGGHVFPSGSFDPLPEGYKPFERLRTLLIIEGEINAMSCWQVAHETRLDVLSIGSEATRITPGVVEFAKRYGTVMVWLDRPEMAQRVMAALPGAHGVKSLARKDDPTKKIDANDRLRDGTLGGYLATVRANFAKDASELEALLWNLYDAAMLPMGVDMGTAMVIEGLAGKLGKNVQMVELEPDRWLAAAKLREWGWAEYQDSERVI